MNSVYLVKQNALRDLLIWLSNGETRKTICSLLKISNSALSYKITELKAKGLIEETSRGIYKLTLTGTFVKDSLIQSVKTPSQFRCHHQIRGIKILDYGSYKFNPKLQKKMRGGWCWQKIRIRGYNVRIQTTGTMAVICPPTIGLDKNEQFEIQINEANKIAEFIANKYHMKLGEFYRIREGHSEVIGSERLAQYLGYVKVAGVWVDASGGKGKRLEENQDSTDIEKLIDLPNRMEKMESLLERFTEQIELHLVVMNNINTGITELRDAVKSLSDKKP